MGLTSLYTLRAGTVALVAVDGRTVVPQPTQGKEKERKDEERQMVCEWSRALRRVCGDGRALCRDGERTKRCAGQSCVQKMAEGADVAI